MYYPGTWFRRIISIEELFIDIIFYENI